MDLFGREILLQVTNELLKGPSALSYRMRERTIEFPMKQELPVLGIKADDIGRQHIDAEIRRELRNAFAIMLCKFIACHEISTRKADSPVATALSSSSRSCVSGLTLLDRFSACGRASHAGRAHPPRSAGHITLGRVDPGQTRACRASVNEVASRVKLA